MRKESYCNKTPCYFKEQNLIGLYGLYNEKQSFDLSQHYRRNNPIVSYNMLWKQLKKDNLNLYNQIRSIAEQKNELLGDLETKMFFITGRQFHSDINKITIDQKSRLLSIINSILRREIGNPLIRSNIIDPKLISNNGNTTFANAHNIGNLRTGINHLINENIINFRWSQFVNNDFVLGEIIDINRDKLFQYGAQIRLSLGNQDNIEKTDREFGFERMIRDIIRTDLLGVTIHGIQIPIFSELNHYKHEEFETDAIGETGDQRWIIELSTGHKNSNEIIKKFYRRKLHFNSTRGDKKTIGLFIVSGHGTMPECPDQIIVLTISEFIKILNENNIRDTISCFGFK